MSVSNPPSTTSCLQKKQDCRDFRELKHLEREVSAREFTWDLINFIVNDDQLTWKYNKYLYSGTFMDIMRIIRLCFKYSLQ